ncbi:MAG: hypothetical protein P1U70_06180 [Saprospiraceae bacterium]|jgi:hypothetical protein|nr:hypothetical protein [Saprospiraceae bacterium]
MEHQNEISLEGILIGAMDGNTHSIIQLLIIALIFALVIKLVQVIYKRGELLFKVLFIAGLGIIMFGLWHSPDRVYDWVFQVSEKVNELIMSIS